jgi:eukaryotic-like serine/threonine-protein kinase
MTQVFGPGDPCGPYRIEREIGRGGMSVVYLARTAAGEARAIKVLAPRARVNADLADRFTREVQLLGYLDHVHVVRFYEAGVLDGQLLWMALEHLEGKTAREVIVAGPVGADAIIRWGRQVAQGIAQAHRLGVVHRDIKPENVMICQGDVAKVLDFGIAKYDAWDFQSTASGQTLGTIAYMAPEQLEDRRLVDARSDVYSLGLVLYELACGRHPYVEIGAPLDVNGAILRKLIGEAPPLAERAPELPADLAAIIHRAFAREPAERFATMQDLDDALAEAARRRVDERRASLGVSPPLGARVTPEPPSPPPPPPPRPRPALGAAALGAVTGGALGVLLFFSTIAPALPVAISHSAARRAAPPATTATASARTAASAVAPVTEAPPKAEPTAPPPSPPASSSPPPLRQVPPVRRKGSGAPIKDPEL